MQLDSNRRKIPRPIEAERQQPEINVVNAGRWSARSWFYQRAIIVLLAGLVTIAFSGERTGFIPMTRPEGKVTPHNSTLGYSVIFGDQVYHWENIQFIQQILFFCGVENAVPLEHSWLILRGITPLVQSYFVSLFGFFDAALLVNYLVFLAALWFTWKLTVEVTSSYRAGVFAILFCLFGTGFVAHLGDLSTHIVAYTTYFLGCWVLYKLDLVNRPISLRQHLFLGAVFGVVSLTYNTGQMLIAGYVLLALLGRNKIAYIVIATLFALSFRPGLVFFLSQIGIHVDDSVEHRFLAESLRVWKSHWDQGLSVVFMKFGEEFLNYFGFETPIALLCATGGLFLLPRRFVVRFVLPLLLIPIFCCIPFALYARARGYLIYGVSILVFVAAGALLGRLSSSIKTGRNSRIGLALVVCILCAHALWSTAFVWGHYGPLKSYFTGYSTALPLFKRLTPTRFVSMTDQEPVPALFGGQPHVSVHEAGLVHGNDPIEIGPEKISVKQALFARAYFVFGICLIFLLGFSDLWLGIVVTLVFLFFQIGITFVTTSFLPKVPQYLVPRENVKVTPGRTLHYRVSMGLEFKSLLLATFRPQYQIIVYTDAAFRGNNNLPLMKLVVGSREFVLNDAIVDHANRRRQYVVPGEPFVEALRNSDNVEFQVTSTDETVYMGGWQRKDLKNRMIMLQTIGKLEQPYERAAGPAFEIRLVRPDQTIALGGF